MKRFSIMAALLLGACSATGAPYTEHTDIRHGTIVVYRGSSLDPNSFAIGVNGKPVCDLAGKGFFVAHSDGVTNLSASEWSLPGTSRLSIEAKPGNVRYVRIDRDSDKYLATAGGGFLGALIAEGTSDKSGPFNLVLVDPGVARAELQDLKEGCK